MKLIYSTKKLVYYKLLFNQQIIYNKDFKNLIIKYEKTVIYNNPINLKNETLIENIKSPKKIFTFDNLYIRTDVSNKIENINILHRHKHNTPHKLFYYDFCYDVSNDDVSIHFN